MSSVGSNSPDPRHLKLVQASAAGKEDIVKQLLGESAWHSQMDRDALRQSLQRCAARGNLSLSRFLIEKGAEVDARKAEVAALFRAAENGHVKVVQFLLDSGADPDCGPVLGRDRYGRTPLFPAAHRGYMDVVKALLDNDADINARDKEERTVLIHMAEEKPGNTPYGRAEEIVRLLLERGANLEARDTAKRTALIWASATGKVDTVRLLLEGKNKPDLEAGNSRGRTALHFAAESNNEAIVSLLLDHHASPRQTSDGGWTALHNAAEKGHINVVDKLLEAGAPVNAELSNGMTCLHWAAQNGHIEVVQRILHQTDLRLSIKDSFDRTPMLCAAEQGHREIVYLLSPGKTGGRLSEKALRACESFEATVVDFGMDSLPKEKRQRVLKTSVYDLLYGWDHSNDKPKVPSQVQKIKTNPKFRWVHIPANNVAWVEAMLTKSFVEAGHRDIDDFKALEKCFSQEHRGPTVHASFMRTFCHRIPPMPSKALPNESTDEQKKDDEIPPSAVSPTTPQIKIEAATPVKTTAPTLQQEKEPTTPRLEKTEKRKTKAEKFAERHGKKGTKADGTNGNKGNVGKGKATEKGGNNPQSQKTPQNKSVAKTTGPSGKIVLFMPFLHYESDESRKKMSHAIKRTYRSDPKDPLLSSLENPTPDDLLIEAYLNASPPLHARRTLDQFFYHGIDTSQRDQDQVVYRYCQRRHLKPHVFMVDQLWVWILGKELIVTSFPQRWNQPKDDPLRVLDGIIEDMNAKTRPPVESVYDLAMLITGRCSGMFDRHRLDDETYQFLDMFESSIGHVTNQETKLFARFNTASAVAAKWLKYHRRSRGNSRRHSGTVSEDEARYDTDPVFVDALLEIGIETKLLAEIKDIRDELNIIKMVLQYQMNVLPEMAEHISEELGRKAPQTWEIKKRSKEQLKIIEVHIKDVERMDRQCAGIYTSFTHLLDLKQKHANAFEARFARDQAQLTAWQGQTIMVFTIVTIVFLPMSFIAAIFTINIQEFPRGLDGSPALPLAYVTKWTFGIGFAISIPLIFLSFAVDDIAVLFRKFTAPVFKSVSRLTGKPPRPRTPRDPLAEDQITQTGSHRRHNSASGNSGIEKLRDQVDGSVTNGRISLGLDRDMSPMSDHTRNSYSMRNHVTWIRGSSTERGHARFSEDLERGR